jgi:hypothetical protein
MSQVKGSNFVSLRAFTNARGATQRLRETLEPEVLATFDQALAIGWYPATTFVAALHALGPAVGEPGAEAMAAYGSFAAEHDLTTLHRVFFRFANPAYVLEKSTQYWSRFHDRGEWRITRETRHGARAELVRCGIVDALFCDVLGAYITRMFALVGAKDPRWTHPECRARGAESCVFVGEWE